MVSVGGEFATGSAQADRQAVDMRSGAVSRATESSGTRLQPGMTNKTKRRTQMEIHGNERRTGAICALKQTIARSVQLATMEAASQINRAVGEAGAKLPQRSRMRPCVLAHSLRIKRGRAGCLPGLPEAPPTPGPQNPTSPHLPLSPNTQMTTACNAARGKSLLS